MNEINDRKQINPQTTFGLVTLNHFGISVQDLDRSIEFYQALTGQEPAAIGTWSSPSLDSAAGISDSRSRRAVIRWATIRINNVNIDLLQVKKEGRRRNLTLLGQIIHWANRAQFMSVLRLKIWNLFLSGCKTRA